MSRTTTTEVETYLGANWDGSTDTTSYIDMASAVTDQVVACAATKGITLSDTILLLIEKNLACHFYQQQDKLYQSKNTGKAGATFQGRTDIGYESSDYGANALRLDISGCLRIFDKGARVNITWLGSDDQDLE